MSECLGKKETEVNGGKEWAKMKRIKEREREEAN